MGVATHRRGQVPQRCGLGESAAGDGVVSHVDDDRVSQSGHGRGDEQEQDERHAGRQSIPVGPTKPLGRDLPRRLGRISVVTSLLLVLAAAVLFLAPAPHRYIRLSPGPSPDVLTLVKVEGAPSYESSSRLGMALVIVAPVDNLFELTRANLDPDSDVRRREEVIPPDVSDEQNNRENRQAMSTSQQDATFVALKYLGYDVKALGKGARVLQVFPDTPASGKLEKDDVITAIEGQPVATRDDAVRLVTSRPIGSMLRLTVTRHDGSLGIDLTTQESPEEKGRPVLGVAITTDEPSFSFPPQPKIDIDAQGVGGPSAGLVYTLAIVDVLTPGDITGGHDLAATGEIGLDGRVGAVGGLREKAIGVEKAGAEYFLVPKGDNYEEARKAVHRMKVVPVETLDDALGFLKELRRGEALQLPVH